ncbi:MAG TPA: zf-HC2 domain-containing protein [Candidatus Angelobacter sp.]|nr:zf-HC2 domain-containing protein [Candidatus Angelobacter sp.]
MNCESVQDLLPLYLSGELTGTALGDVQSHIDACELCSRALNADRELDDVLRTAMLENSPDVSAVLNRVHAGITAPAWKRMLRPGWVRASVLATAIVLIAWLGFVGFRVRQGERTMALAAANDHYSDLVLLRHSDWTYKPQDVAHFIQQQFPQQQDLLNVITPDGASFEKVRLCNVGGTYYAHFVFRGGALETSVFLTATKRTNQDPAFHLAEAGYGLEVSEFFSSNLTGMIVGNHGLVPTEKIATRLARAL